MSAVSRAECLNGTKLVGLTRVYVDDFLVAGCDDDSVFSAALSKLKGSFQRRTWNEDNFTLTGIEIERRSRADTDNLTPGELTQLRGKFRSANWLENQTRPYLCVSTSLLQGAHASATVADTREANKHIRLCRQHAHVPGCSRPEGFWQWCEH